jgi:ABC-type antimicrobial peptide transport system permease subunit
MLLSVTERTREIGLRMAVGARRLDILWQFLLEAVMLAGAGALGGLLLGVLTTQAFGYFSGWPAPFEVSAAVGAMLAAGAVGLIAGLLPAQRASRLQPIEALRQE